MPDFPRPAVDEFPSYYGAYINRVSGEDVIEQLIAGCDEAMDLVRSLGEDQGIHRYALDKWSVRELIGHLIDTERLFAFRCLWFARGDEQPQPGMDENAWAMTSNAHSRSLKELCDEYESVRDATLSLMGSFDQECLGRAGIASGSPLTVRSVPWIIAGHEIHHMAVLRERYLA